MADVGVERVELQSFGVALARKQPRVIQKEAGDEVTLGFDVTPYLLGGNNASLATIIITAIDAAVVRYRPVALYLAWPGVEPAARAASRRWRWSNAVALLPGTTGLQTLATAVRERLTQVAVPRVIWLDPALPGSANDKLSMVTVNNYLIIVDTIPEFWRALKNSTVLQFGIGAAAPIYSSNQILRSFQYDWHIPVEEAMLLSHMQRSDVLPSPLEFATFNLEALISLRQEPIIIAPEVSRKNVQQLIRRYVQNYPTVLAEVERDWALVGSQLQVLVNARSNGRSYNLTQLRKEWYQITQFPTIEANGQTYAVQIRNPPTVVSVMIEAYFTTLQWIYQEWQDLSHRDWRWQYQYQVAPTVIAEIQVPLWVDIASAQLPVVKPFANTPPVTPLFDLLITLSLEEDLDLLPKNAQEVAADHPAYWPLEAAARKNTPETSRWLLPARPTAMFEELVSTIWPRAWWPGQEEVITGNAKSRGTRLGERVIAPTMTVVGNPAGENTVVYRPRSEPTAGPIEPAAPPVAPTPVVQTVTWPQGIPVVLANALATYIQKRGPPAQKQQLSRLLVNESKPRKGESVSGICTALKAAQNFLKIAPRSQAGGSVARAENRVREITALLQTAKIAGLPESGGGLDYGAADASISLPLAQELRLNPFYVVDLQPPTNYPSAIYKAPWEMADIPSDSLRLIVMLVTLHHIQTDARLPLLEVLQQFYRELAPGGVLVVREHDVTSENVRQYLYLVHAWFDVIEGRECPFSGNTYTGEQLIFRPEKEWSDIIASVGFVNRLTQRYPNEPTIGQRLYWQVWQKPLTAQ